MTNRSKRAIDVGVYFMAAAGLMCGVSRCAGLGESVTPDMAADTMRLACHALPDVRDRTACLALVNTAADYCDGTPPASLDSDSSPAEPGPAPAPIKRAGASESPAPDATPSPSRAPAAQSATGHEQQRQAEQD